jgi:hypothetical protein
MSAKEKSDLPEVAEKRANKAASAAAELVERRGGAKYRSTGCGDRRVAHATPLLAPAPPTSPSFAPNQNRRRGLARARVSRNMVNRHPGAIRRSSTATPWLAALGRRRRPRQCCRFSDLLSMTPCLVALDRRRHHHRRPDPAKPTSASVVIIGRPEPESANNNPLKRNGAAGDLRPHHRAASTRCTAQAARAGRSASPAQPRTRASGREHG